MFFHDLVKAKRDTIFGLVETFKADSRPQKLNLIVGIYLDEKLTAHVMPSIQKASSQVAVQNRIADYLPIDGLQEFCEKMGELICGDRFWRLHKERTSVSQAIGGTGALQVAGQLLSKMTVAISDPTWANHRGIFTRSGCHVATYPYYNPKDHTVDIEAFFSSIGKLPENSAIVLHAVCHNPTGSDLSRTEWKELSKFLLKKNIFPIFDFAYQGFGEGIEQDRSAIQIFLEDGHEMIVAYSCSKNFSLCRQRLGTVLAVGDTAQIAENVHSQIKSIIRGLYSNPPGYGAQIALKVLQDKNLKAEWLSELNHMRGRLESMRNGLVDRLSALQNRTDFSFLRNQKGMFAFTGLQKEQTERLLKEFAIYILENGRLSLSGLNGKNIDYVAEAIAEVC